MRLEGCDVYGTICTTCFNQKKEAKGLWVSPEYKVSKPKCYWCENGGENCRGACGRCNICDRTACAYRMENFVGGLCVDCWKVNEKKWFTKNFHDS